MERTLSPPHRLFEKNQNGSPYAASHISISSSEPTRRTVPAYNRARLTTRTETSAVIRCCASMSTGVRSAMPRRMQARRGKGHIKAPGITSIPVRKRKANREHQDSAEPTPPGYISYPHSAQKGDNPLNQHPGGKETRKIPEGRQSPHLNQSHPRPIEQPSNVRERKGRVN